MLPVNKDVVQNISRGKLTVVGDGEEEKPIGDDEHLDVVEMLSDTEEGKENVSPKKKVRKMLSAPKIRVC